MSDSSHESGSASNTKDDEKIESFEQFWDFYVGEHKNKTNRILHFIGTTLAMSCVAGALFTRRRWLFLVAPIAGYGFAWVGHFAIEKNKPASFKYPLWSLQADFKMWWKMATFSMQAEVDRVVQAEEEKLAKGREESSASSAAATENEKRDASVQSEAVN
jgi:hypothetical protein